jgi:hypothetical protein
VLRTRDWEVVEEMGITIAAATGIDVGTSSCNHRRTGHGVGTFWIGLGMEKDVWDNVVFKEGVRERKLP